MEAIHRTGFQGTLGAGKGKPAHKDESGFAEPKETFTPTSKEGYHFQPEHPIEFNKASGTWIYHLPNADIPMPRKPAWLDMQDRMNSILDKSSNPPQLRKMADDVTDIANRSYDSGNVRFDPGELKEYLGSVSDREMLTGLKGLFNEQLKNETQSTYQVGGTMAGSLCSQMHRYGSVIAALEERLAVLPGK
jgi:hypothetical protein